MGEIALHIHRSVGSDAEAQSNRLESAPIDGLELELEYFFTINSHIASLHLRPFLDETFSPGVLVLRKHLNGSLNPVALHSSSVQESQSLECHWL